jgi:hypothetical protein
MLASLTRNAVRGCCVIAAGLLLLAAQAQPASKLSRAVTIVDPVAPGDGVEHRQQLAYAGDQRHFPTLAGARQQAETASPFGHAPRAEFLPAESPRFHD